MRNSEWEYTHQELLKECYQLKISGKKFTSKRTDAAENSAIENSEGSHRLPSEFLKLGVSIVHY